MAQADTAAGVAPGAGIPTGAEEYSRQQNTQMQEEMDFPKEGELVILYGSREMILSCVLTKAGVCRTRLGNFDHEDIMKTRIGHKYHADISLILSLLDVRPGKTIVEAGTGSGSLSYSLAMALRPNGRLFTFEFHEQRWQEAREEFKLLGISGEVEAIHRDVCADGFCLQQVPAGIPASSSLSERAIVEENEQNLPAPHAADGVFLDLPSPWLALKHADHVLKGGGRLVTFSPCVEQLHKTFVAAQELGFQATPELEDPSRTSSYHYQLPMKGHTGYVAYCVKPSEDESLQPQP
ncbi:tRNA (adenine-N(1)-)-methyltransferase catalytic subunit, putative [Eimeria brunetti]|uniref:tRNA (adenine(58)-N(1))-methyltransferase n=1 Tax=Eimeria brunetti TaxID=51314 RepID=U6LD25_9EIME|nr:tRNA (adenine-N(1)-)-methyltransferase catalytic subunit, putative [Eimeria brunetti]